MEHTSNKKMKITGSFDSLEGVPMDSGEGKGDGGMMDWELADVAPHETAEVGVSSQKDPEGFSFDFDFDLDDDESETETVSNLPIEPAMKFDLKVLQRAFEESAAALATVEGQDVVMVVGKTGVGKSTLIQGIAGKKIRECTHKTCFHGQIAEKIVFEAVDALEAFEIGHSTESKTSSLNAFVHQHGNHHVVFLDSPGVEDTTGVEMDIATSALLSQVSKKCKSLRFVVLVHCASLIEDRGGAFRSVLKFARTFVQDFNVSKSSFMFLFTHSDDIAGMSASLIAARERLLKEVIHTAKGTKDDDLLAVLNFVRKSLKNKIPFVDIFHPLQMDFTRLIHFIEKGLKKVTDLSLANACNLTLSSKLKLEGAVQNLVQGIRVAFKDMSSPDIVKVKDAQTTLHTLETFIDVDCVRSAALESKEIIDDRIASLKSFVDAESTRGMSFDAEFNVENAKALKEALLHLQELDSNCSYEWRLNGIKRDLVTFQDQLLLRVHSSTPFQHELHKLFVWSQCFEELSELYNTACKKINDHIDSISAAVKEFDLLIFDKVAKKEVCKFVDNLGRLNFLGEHLTQFPVGISAEKLLCTRDNAMGELMAVFQSWISIVEDFADESQPIDFRNGLEAMSSRVHILQKVQAHLKDQGPCFSFIEAPVIETLKNMEENVIGRFVACCNEMMGDTFQPTWELQFSWMRTVCDNFATDNGSSWKVMHSAYSSVIDNAKSCLHPFSGELENMSLIVAQNGVRSGESLANDVLFVSSCCWFDSFLKEEARFAGRSYAKIKNAMNDRIQEKEKETEACLRDLSNNALKSSKSISKLGEMLPELREIDVYSTTMSAEVEGESMDVEGSEELSKKCVAHLEEYTCTLTNLANKLLGHWTSGIKKGSVGYLRSMSRKINLIGVHAEALMDTQASQAVMRKAGCIISRIHEECTQVSQQMELQFASLEGDTMNKVQMLLLLQSCIGYSHIEGQLPDFKKVIHHLRDIVTQDAHRLEEKMMSSSNWDEMNNDLKVFESSLLLDEFVSNEVSARLRSLRRQLDQKEDHVDDLLKSLIREQDFKGIAKFLTPLAKSKNQLKVHKFQMHQNEICLGLEETLNSIHRLLGQDSITEQDLKDISQKMGVLTAASSELGNLLKERLDLDSELGKLRDIASNKAESVAESLIRCTEEKDFVQLVFYEDQASIFSRSKKYLKYHVNRKLKSALENSKAEVKALPRYINKFMKSAYNDGEDLMKFMAGLKRASEMTDSSFEKYATMYSEGKADMESKLQNAIGNIEQVVSETQCYDDAIPVAHALYRQLHGPLKIHSSTGMLSRSENLIDSLREEKKEHDRQFEFGGGDYNKKIDQWSKKLDSLSTSSPWDWQYWTWREKRVTYKNLCAKLLDMVEGRYNIALSALKARDLLSVKECMGFLIAAEKKVKKHLPDVKTRLQDLRSLCVSSFLKLCDEAKQILESKNKVQFEEIFADYRGFVIGIPCVLKSEDGQKMFSLINQLLFESLDHDVCNLQKMAEDEVIDLSQLRSQVLHVRSLGNFFADRITLLHEEIKSCPHAKPERWLSEIHDLCWKHFSDGRDLSMIKYCAILGVTPSADQSDINKAYREKARRYHPDKVHDSQNDKGEMMRKVNDAHEKLLTMSHLSKSSDTQAFDTTLIGIGEHLRLLARQFMRDARYAMAEKLLFELPNVKLLDDLVNPRLESDEVISNVQTIIKGHVTKVRTEVDSAWSERRYKDLNDSITDLKQMESSFKAYPEIFPTSWDTGIVETIEKEIEALGQKARSCLQSRAVAKEKQEEFKRCFLGMGFVLFELPSFKSFTKQVMSGVLESCLDSDWGYGFLFEFGLGLQRGDDSSNDSENRCAQMLVSEFSHFKEVMTMVWNQETSQKPAEDTVQYIKGEHRQSASLTSPLVINQSQLLNSFHDFEKEYKSLLAEYIQPNADLNILVKQTLVQVESMKPLRFDIDWDDDTKKIIPKILAAVFALFTVVKSGASFNRIEASGASSDLGEKMLMKPHNIQVLTILYMFGCGGSFQTAVESKLMQIRTGEGKSMILGAAAVLFGLLGFQVRTVCYSEYLSTRDFKLFEEVFDRFGLTKFVKYSKITSFAEDSTAAKGDIRSLTESLLRGTLSNQRPSSSNNSMPSLKLDASSVGAGSQNSTQTKPVFPKPSIPAEAKNSIEPVSKTDAEELQGAVVPAQINTKEKAARSSHFVPETREEILLVDEVDVFFGSDFYGQTYNQVVEFREPEVEEILKRIWSAYSQGGRRLKLSDIQSMPEYASLLNKLSPFSFMLDNEIALMLDQVKRVDDIPYYLDPDSDRIGYKVMDSISYDATYGYTTAFAYLKEYDNLKDKNILSKVLSIPVSCGQFSYANISPYRILGVSGTLQALGEYEKEILCTYGLNKFVFVPSVYGESNFEFDKAGDGIYFEKNQSDFFHRISAEIMAAAKAKRAVIVFFHDRTKLNEFVASPIYRQLGRHKKLLTENMTSSEKEFVINKAATAGQITLSTAVFGRGTDFFCKDDTVQKNGGVHIIQTFLSEDESEEIQIQGRTARQGKRGSYQIVLLESDLESEYGVPTGERDKVSKKDSYDWLCKVRNKQHTKKCKLTEENLTAATEKDQATHKYFDSLLAHSTVQAQQDFEKLYHSIKKPPYPSSITVDLCFAIDVTGSMGPYAQCVASTTSSLVTGQHSIIEKLKSKFSDIEFKLRVACLCFRDIDDKIDQFQESVWSDGGHFTENMSDAMDFIKQKSSNNSGGFDLAEDHIGAIDRCTTSWNHANDWTSEVKCMMLMSDAPSHGLVPKIMSNVTNADGYSTRHPVGITLQNVVSSLLSRGIDLFFCSFNPVATKLTEDEISKSIKSHSDNVTERDLISIPMVPNDALKPGISSLVGGSGRHIIFVLDESSSMSPYWAGVVQAYNQYLERRKRSQSESDLVSVVQFDDSAHVTVLSQPLSAAPKSLSYRGRGTRFHPAAIEACSVARKTPSSHTPAIVFMSDGEASDASAAAQEFSVLNDFVSNSSENDLELHVIAFGSGASASQLQQIANASKFGKVHSSANTAALANIFVNIATNQNVATLVESEIAKRISEAVSDKLSLEYFGG